MGAPSVEVEYSALVCNHNYSLCVIYWYGYLSRVYLPTSNISICSVKVLGGGRTTVITTLYSEKTSYSWSASVILIFKTSSGKFGVN